MTRTQFIPARDSRHRTAVVALFRALAKTASKITLADQAGVASTDRRPIQSILRRRFDKNAGDTSPRLVFAALAAGYKSLSFLTKAQDPSSAEHEQILCHLSKRRAPTEQPSVPLTEHLVEKREPLLSKVSEPGETPKYVANAYPRPLNSLAGPRRVPMVATTADGLPFLRTSSLQPRDMSRMIGRKVKVFQSRIAKITEIQDELLPDAASEDHWDGLVARQLQKEGLQREKTGDVEESYTWSLYLSRLWLEWKIEATWQDWLARGEALQSVVDAEQELADQEAGKIRNPEPTIKEHAQPPPAVNVSSREVNFMGPPKLKGSAIQMDGHDIFATEAWAAIVRSRRGILQSWISKAQTA